MADYSPHPVILHATIGRGGSTLHMDCRGTKLASSTTQGYDRTVADLMAYAEAHNLTWAAGAVIIDTTTIPDDQIARYAIRGPITDPYLEPGTVSRFDIGTIFNRGPWTVDPDDPLKGLGSFDAVAPDIAVTIAYAFGATITAVHCDDCGTYVPTPAEGWGTLQWCPEHAR